MAKQGTPVDERLDETAAELYAASPDEFVARRDEAARELTSAGDRKLAAEVRKLRKPTVSAWAINQLVRSYRDDVESFVALGPAMAEAQRDLDAEKLRSLSVQRQRLVQALVEDARELAAEAGHQLGGPAAYEVETTLNAALADPDVAERVRSGRLVKAESYAGFGPFGGAPQLRLVEPGLVEVEPGQAEPRAEPPARDAGREPARAPAKTAKRAGAPDRAAEPAADAAAADQAAAQRVAERRERLRQERERAREEREQARRERDQTARRVADRKASERRRLEQAVEDARTALDEAETVLAEANADADLADEARGELREQATHLREQLADIERRIAETDLDRRRLRQVSERAKARVARAAKQVEAAERRLSQHNP